MQVLDFDSRGYIDISENGPVIYKALSKIGLGKLWDSLNSGSECGTRVNRDEFTKVFLTWVGVDEQFELQTANLSRGAASAYFVPSSLHQHLLIVGTPLGLIWGFIDFTRARIT
jgi:hypothetical protein